MVHGALVVVEVVVVGLLVVVDDVVGARVVVDVVNGLAPLLVMQNLPSADLVILVGYGHKFCNRFSLPVLGLTQSSNNNPPVSPELGFRDQKNWSVESMSFRYFTILSIHTFVLLSSYFPPHSPITKAA